MCALYVRADSNMYACLSRTIHLSCCNIKVIILTVKELHLINTEYLCYSLDPSRYIEVRSCHLLSLGYYIADYNKICLTFTSTFLCLLPQSVSAEIPEFILSLSALFPFPTMTEPKVHLPTIGEPLVLRCNPPYSYPSGILYWAESKPGAKISAIDNTKRVSQDFEGIYCQSVV